MKKSKSVKSELIITIFSLIGILIVDKFAGPTFLQGSYMDSNLYVILAILQIMIGIMFYYFIFMRLKEKGEKVSRIIFNLVFLHIPIIGLLVLYDIVKDKQIKDIDEIEENIATTVPKTLEKIETPELITTLETRKNHNKAEEIGSNKNIFERLISHFLIKPLFYKRYESFFSNTKLGRVLVVIYLFTFYLVIGLIVLATISEISFKDAIQYNLHSRETESFSFKQIEHNSLSQGNKGGVQEIFDELERKSKEPANSGVASIQNKNLSNINLRLTIVKIFESNSGEGLFALFACYIFLRLFIPIIIFITLSSGKKTYLYIVKGDPSK